MGWTSSCKPFFPWNIKIIQISLQWYIMNTTHQDYLGNIHASDPKNPHKYQIISNYELRICKWEWNWMHFCHVPNGPKVLEAELDEDSGSNPCRWRGAEKRKAKPLKWIETSCHVIQHFMPWKVNLLRWVSTLPKANLFDILWGNVICKGRGNGQIQFQIHLYSGTGVPDSGTCVGGLSARHE